MAEASPFAALPRHLVEALIQAAIDHLDALDGDADSEEAEPIEDDDEDCCQSGEDGRHFTARN